ncbi:MAG: F0F1 ATP synthase subunit delta [Bacilli bacterium]|nr:F0F1 ATP synthase subunit delta [Bacilli bacterium]
MSKIIVYTAKELTSDFKKKITDKILKKEKECRDIEFVVMPSLVGGIVIKKDDVVYDGSISGELLKIKKHLSR